MKVRLWTCGLVAALAGCSTVDRGYEPPIRGPLGAAPVAASPSVRTGLKRLLAPITP